MAYSSNQFSYHKESNSMTAEASNLMMEIESLYTASYLSGEDYWAVFDPDGNFVECVETIEEFRELYK